MSDSISITCGFDVRDALSEIGLCFVGAPLHRINFHVTEDDIQILAQVYRSRVFRARRKAGAEAFSWRLLLLRFAENLFVCALGNGRDSAEIFAPTEEQATTLHAELMATLQLHRPASVPFFYMLRYDFSEFQAERVEHLPDDPGDEFLRLCYGADIDGWLAQFHERTASRPGGLTILEGPPGTGKTSLVSVMMRRLAETHVFYVLPVAQDNALSSPELVPFWQTQNKRHPNRIKVIVIEDAERLLYPRRPDNREAVSSVLNIADGLIGRMLRLHPLCSVNASLDELDSAVMRPGRLMNQRAFRPLPRTTAQRLAALRSLPFEPGDESEEFALADVLNPAVRTNRASKQIGFARGN